ncbi:MAG: hypothetical protein Kow0042_05920 [Calditrichia bacterium]
MSRLILSKRIQVLILIAGFLLLLFIATFSSNLPDGLEWTVKKLGLEGSEKTVLPAPLADYNVSEEYSPSVNRILTALIGMALLALIIFLIFQFKRAPVNKE